MIKFVDGREEVGEKFGKVDVEHTFCIIVITERCLNSVIRRAWGNEIFDNTFDVGRDKRNKRRSEQEGEITYSSETSHLSWNICDKLKYYH